MKASLHMLRNISFHPILLNVALKIAMFAVRDCQICNRKILIGLCLQMSLTSSIKCDGYLITSTYCIDVLPLIV